jgi:hypothetical protein
MPAQTPRRQHSSFVLEAWRLLRCHVLCLLVGSLEIAFWTLRMAHRSSSDVASPPMSRLGPYVPARFAGRPDRFSSRRCRVQLHESEGMVVAASSPLTPGHERRRRRCRPNGSRDRLLSGLVRVHPTANPPLFPDDTPRQSRTIARLAPAWGHAVRQPRHK